MRKQHTAVKEEVTLRQRKRGIRPAPYHDANSKRSTINLGVEDLPSGPRPESVSKFRTDDEVKVLPYRDTLCLSSLSKHEDGVPFLTRERLCLGDTQISPEMRSCWKEKENKLRERKNSLLAVAGCDTPGQSSRPRRRHLHDLMPMSNTQTHEPFHRDEGDCQNKEGTTSPPAQPGGLGESLEASTAMKEAPVPPPRRKRDARKRKELALCNSGTNTSPCTPVSLSSIDTPGTPGSPGTPGTINTTSTASLPSTPYSPDTPDNFFFNEQNFVYGHSPDMSSASDTGRAVSSTPDTLSSPDTPGRASTRSLVMEDNVMFDLRKKSHTMDNRIRQRPHGDEWETRGSNEILSQGRHPPDLRRSVSEYHRVDLGGSSNKARRTISDSDKQIKHTGRRSIKDRIFRSNKNEGASLGISARALHRWSSYRKNRSRSRKESAEDHSDDAGVVARVTHGSQGSAPSSPQLACSRSVDSTPTKKNLLQFLKKGTKSSSKSPKGKANRGADGCGVEGGGGEDGLSRSHSHENIYHSPGHLSSPLQSRSRLHHNQDDTRRTENTLKIWIMEAKNIPSKKKYFCHLIVDLQPNHRTCSKTMANMCFWGEYFELQLNPETTTICIELKREGDKKIQKKIGSVEIDLKPSSPGRATPEEQWYPVRVDKQDKSSPALRIKHRFQSLDILPVSQYIPIRQYLKENATSLCQLLEPVLSVKAKQDIATTLVNIMQAENCAVNFLVDLVYKDIQTNAENEHLLFRGNSVATKAIEAYMKLVGEQYLHDTLLDPIHTIITSSDDLEVDPLKIVNFQAIQGQRNSLKKQVTDVWERILVSCRNFPLELRQVFHKLREQLSRQEKCELTDNLISSCVFLRFICPAVLSPSLFNIVPEYPDEHAVRKLTLVTKTLQTLANFTHFQGKERYMEFLNDFISKEQDRCRTFLGAISSPLSPEDSILEFDGKIDLGKHLALLHFHLAGVLAEINTQGYESEASRVMALVEDISALLGDNHSGAPFVNRPASGTPTTTSTTQAAAVTHMHTNNNYMREGCAVGLDEAGNGVGGGVPSPANRSQSLPRSATPVYAHHPMHQHQGRAGPGGDLVPSEEYVLRTDFDQASRPQISMYLSEEASNNNPPAMDVGVNNGNNYYITHPPVNPLHQVHHPVHHQVHNQPYRALLHNTTQPRPHPRACPTRNAVGGVPGPVERQGLERNYSDFFRCMDDMPQRIIAVYTDGENNNQGSQTSISQLSNIASSGYQSFAYSQSSSPVDSLLYTDNSSLFSRENGNPGMAVGIRQVLHDSPLASPLHHQASKFRAMGMHPAYLGHTGHTSLQGTPRHAPRVPQPKESPNSSLSSSQSVEDLSSLRRGRTRHRRSASSSSDSSPDSHVPSHSKSHFRRAPAHTPRTNPHCSPRLVPSPALRQELRSAKQRHDRSVSSRRGKTNRSCDRDDLRGVPPQRCDDSEDELNVGVGSLGGAGAGGWGMEGWQEHPPAHNIAPQQLLDQQEDQMRAIIERLMSMEQEFRHEQEIMRLEMHNKDARINAQEKKIAALDTANTHLIRTIASLSTRPGELKPDLSGDLHNDSCNASDTSDYKSSSC